jgi:hypothetical protein
MSHIGFSISPSSLSHGEQRKLALASTGVIPLLRAQAVPRCERLILSIFLSGPIYLAQLQAKTLRPAPASVLLSTAPPKEFLPSSKTEERNSFGSPIESTPLV